MASVVPDAVECELLELGRHQVGQAVQEGHHPSPFKHLVKKNQKFFLIQKVSWIMYDKKHLG